METNAAVVAPAVQKTVPAYPTLPESWGVLGYCLLVSTVVAVPAIIVLRDETLATQTAAAGVFGVLGNMLSLLFLHWKAGPRWQLLRMQGQEQPWLYVVLPILVLSANVVLSLLDFLHLPNWFQDFFINITAIPALALGVLVVGAPVLEELLMRGVVLQGLLRNCRPWVAISQSALIFGVMHINPAQSVNAALLGLLLGWLYYRTRSLWLCIAVHALNNLLALGGMLFAPPAWQNMTTLEVMGSGCGYAGAVLTSAAIGAVILWRVRQTTLPAAEAAAVEEPAAFAAGFPITKARPFSS